MKSWNSNVDFSHWMFQMSQLGSLWKSTIALKALSSVIMPCVWTNPSFKDKGLHFTKKFVQLRITLRDLFNLMWSCHMFSQLIFQRKLQFYERILITVNAKDLKRMHYLNNINVMWLVSFDALFLGDMKVQIVINMWSFNHFSSSH